MNSTQQIPAISIPAVAAFGVAIMPDGSLAEIKEGSFDVGQAEKMASRLVLLAAKIRNTTRRRLAQST